LKTYENPYKGIFTGNGALSGNPGEVTFKRAMNERGWVVISSSEEQNRYEHIDYLCYKCKWKIAVEVKRANDSFNNLVMQLIGYYGQPGSLYGKATLLAYVHQERIYLFKREELLTYALKYLAVNKIELSTQSNGRGEFFYIDKDVLLNNLPHFALEGPT